MSWEPLHDEVHLDNLPLLEEHLDLPAWLAEHEPRLHRLLYAADAAQAAALGGLQRLTQERDLPELTQQLARLERDLHDDLPAAIGHAKDLVETACKTVLGHSGPGAGGKGPALVDAALRAVGRSAATVDPGDPDVQLLRKLLSAVSTQLQAGFELRNRVSTGHGRAGDVPVDEPLAQLTIGQALVAVTYLLRLNDQSSAAGAPEDTW